MKTINSTEDITVEELLQDMDENKQPCWYVDFDKQKLEWNVGVKFQKQSEECVIKLSSVKNKEARAMPDLDFAIKVIDLFRKGGKKNVERWVEL